MAKTSEAKSVDPRELIINESANGRRFPAKIDDMVRSLLDNGQETPIKVRLSPTEQDKMEVVFGFRRARAALKITLENLMPDGSPFPLRYELSDRTDAAAFLSNVIENRGRVDTTAIDDAYIIRRLKEDFEMSQRDIAKKMDVSESWVTQTLKLLKLSVPEQKLVALHHTSGGTKGIAPSAAYELADLEPEDRKKQVQDMISGGKKITRATVRKKKAASGGSEKVRTSKEIRLAFDEQVQKVAEGAEMEPWQEFCKDMVKACMGKLGLKAIIGRLREHYK